MFLQLDKSVPSYYTLINEYTWEGEYIPEF
jgi:hypothetical protein